MRLINDIRKRLAQSRPLIHCITNPISINQCANAILAVGARPMMAEHPQEVQTVTATAGALMLNLGNFTDVRAQSMLLSAHTAAEKEIPFLLDVCGAAGLKNRRGYALSLAEKFRPAVIKGNRSEITALYDAGYTATGVDSAIDMTLERSDSAAAALARQTGCIVLASGQTDTVTDGRRMTHILNGSPRMGTVTGTGCMQGALCAAFMSVCDAYTAAVGACILLGVSGELAEGVKGSGSYAVALMDGISELSDNDIAPLLRLEEKDIG